MVCNDKSITLKRCYGSGLLILLAFPDAVEHPSIREYSNVDVGNKDVVEAALFFVAEERVGHPNLLCVGHR